MDNPPGITLLGLGPGDPDLLTRQAWEILETVPEIYLRTRHHPVVASLPQHLIVQSFDDLYEKSQSFADVYTQIVDQVLLLGRRPQGVIYGLPGHPCVAEKTSLDGCDADVATLLPNVDRGWTRPGVKDDLARVGLTRPFALATLLVGTSPAVRAFAADGAIQTDDHTPLEFSAPRALYGARDAGVVGTLLDLAARTGAPAWASGHLARATAADWLATGAMLLRADAHARAFEAYARVFAVDPNDYGAVGGLLDAAARAGRTDDARARLERQARQGPQWAAARVGLSRVAAATGTFDAAAELAREAVAAAPGEPRTWERLASVAADAGNVAALGEVVGELSRRFPAQPLTAYFQGSLAFLQGDLEAAAAPALDATRGDGALARAHNLLGAARASQGHPAGARAAFQRALEADPTDVTTYVNLARLESTQGDFERARGLLAEALVVAPDADEARAGLAAVLDRLGQPERARALRTPRASF